MNSVTGDILLTHSSAVIGFDKSHYQLTENSLPYHLTVKVLTPPESLIESVGLTIGAIHGSALRERQKYF